MASFTASGLHIPCCLGVSLRQHSGCPQHLRHHATAGMAELNLLEVLQSSATNVCEETSKSKKPAHLENLQASEESSCQGELLVCTPVIVISSEYWALANTYEKIVQE